MDLFAAPNENNIVGMNTGADEPSDLTNFRFEGIITHPDA